MKKYSPSEMELYLLLTRNIALQIQKVMLKKKIPQSVLAQKTGLTQGHVCYIVQGERPVSLEGLRLIAKALEVPITKLVPKYGPQDTGTKTVSRYTKSKRKK